MPTDTPAKQRSAGRDLPAAIAVGVLLGGSLIAILLFAPLVWVGVVAAAMAGLFLTSSLQILRQAWREARTGDDLGALAGHGHAHRH